MKVCLNIKFVDGPFGGAMQFAKSLRDYLQSKGVSVVNNLKDDDIDIILHIAPFPIFEICSFTYIDAYQYKLHHPKTVIVLRVNECDERKGTNYMNRLIIQASKHSDFIVFIASWLKPLLEKQGLPTPIPSQVILNGADATIYNRDNKKSWKRNRKLKIVTHHFGGSELKGHDIYKKLDFLLNDPPYRDKFKFTFIGNIPKNINYSNTTIIPPLHEATLAKELKQHNVYLTASRNEPAGMHHIEGALCGLPLLYINSGALPEYCNGFGIEFTPENFQSKLLEMYENYEHWFNQMSKYKNTSLVMTSDFYELFLKLQENSGSFMHTEQKNTSTIGKNIILRTKNLLLHADRYLISFNHLIEKK
jgi:hypothetical protein